MFRNIVFLVVFFIGIVSVVSGQTGTKMNVRDILIELENMLTEIPETKEGCQALIKQIKDWQQKKFKELETSKAMFRITAPTDKAIVTERQLVEGIVVDPNAKVWVIVHPMEISDYWVQPSVNVKEDGTWKVNIYIGRPGDIDKGKYFEIIAVTNPKVSLSEGKILSGWPEAQWKSQVIEVTRK